VAKSRPPQSKASIVADATGSVAHWFRASDDVRTGYVSGSSFDLKAVRYSVLGQMAIFEGDIAIGTVQEMERVAAAVADPHSVPQSGVAIADARFRWPNAVIPYEIHPDLSNPQRVTTAMAHWTENTPLRFVVRDPSNHAHDNYVSFEEIDGCWSEVGMRGGKQVVSLGISCSAGSAIHEIGHVAGLWHEQSRNDRDQFVRILWENVQEGQEHNFDQHISDGDDIGIYDYDSIMHYPALAFSRNGQPTVVAKGGQAIGQRIGASLGDIAAVRAMYPGVQPSSPPATVGPSGTEVLGSIPSFDSKRWITSDWPIEWRVVWSLVPSPIGSRIESSIVTERQAEGLLRYYLSVRNLSPTPVTIEARYVVIAS